MPQPDTSLRQANAERVYEVTRADLPLSCPMPSMALWNSHPRVYLSIEAQGGKAACPYCGAQYVLANSSGTSSGARREAPEAQGAAGASKD